MARAAALLGRSDLHIGRPARLTAALAAVLAAASLAAGLAACGGDDEEAPQAGVAPRSASGVDAAVTDGAVTFNVRDLIGMMADTPSQAQRFNAATRTGQEMAGQPAPPEPRLDPKATPDYFGGVANWANSPRLRKFVDELPGVGAANANGLGQYIPVAVPDTVTYPGSDYYEIAVREYEERLHSDLPPTRLRGYVQINAGTDGAGVNSVAPAPIHYLGPLVRARTGRPVRIKFVNQLPAGVAGRLFLPVDPTSTGAGTGPLGGGKLYPQNRAGLHLHGGITPWISGGTQYQWVSPAGEKSPYRSGPSLVNVPDMWFDAQGDPVGEGTPGATNDPGPGATTLYFPNQQSARFLYLHDDTFGLTRLGVYAGEAAPYVLRDAVEDELVRAGAVPADELPLIIEDKTFVPATPELRAQDPTWDVARWGGLGALWYPHVYMPNQDAAGRVNAKGRWDYLPWYWPGYKGTVNGPVDNPLYGVVASQPEQNPGTPSPSVVPSAFHDTMLVNGTAYPYVRVGRKAYRLRVLNACGDRQLNLSLYYASAGRPDPTGPGGAPQLQTASGEVAMLPAVPPVEGGWPVRWPTDGRPGGVPNPEAAGPPMIQIGNDGGLLPQAVTLPSTPVGLELRNPSSQDQDMGEFPSIIAVTGGALYLAPGERADVIVDFSKAPAGSRLILYNDAPAPAPVSDTRVDYYTGNEDQTAIGGAPATVAGYGPNTRTILQFQVEGSAVRPFDAGRLRAALPAAYAESQDPVLVPTAGYEQAYGADLTASIAAADASASAGAQGAAVQTTSPDGAMQMNPSPAPADGMNGAAPSASPVAMPRADKGILTFVPLGRGYRLTLPVQGKMVSDLFDRTYGRETAALGVDAPLSANGVRTGVPYSAIDPATEYLALEREASAPELGDATQLWRITHDGTESHSISFGGMVVQLVERLRRDGEARPPAPGELGWKDTVRVDPLESVLVAVRPVLSELPFKLPAGVRDLDVTRPPGAEGGFTQLDPVTAAPLARDVVNGPADLSFEAWWGVHLPAGEEVHAVRPLVVQGAAAAPRQPTATVAGEGVVLTWAAPVFPPPVTGYQVRRAGDEAFSDGVRTFDVAGAGTSYTDTTARSGTSYFYSLRAASAAGWSAWSPPAEVGGR